MLKSMDTPTGQEPRRQRHIPVHLGDGNRPGHPSPPAPAPSSLFQFRLPLPAPRPLFMVPTNDDPLPGSFQGKAHPLVSLFLMTTPRPLSALERSIVLTAQDSTIFLVGSSGLRSGAGGRMQPARSFLPHEYTALRSIRRPLLLQLHFLLVVGAAARVDDDTVGVGSREDARTVPSRARSGRLLRSPVWRISACTRIRSSCQPPTLGFTRSLGRWPRLSSRCWGRDLQMPLGPLVGKAWRRKEGRRRRKNIVERVGGFSR
ncbi:hypothetical protein Mapa_002862 [Marchantia paleacea]|nr:hypothetical protein Mapa_002862 [Marchantia paleacea]